MDVIEDLLLSAAKRLLLYMAVALALMVAAHIIHFDVSLSVPAFGYAACFSGAIVLSLLASVVKLLVEVG